LCLFYNNPQFFPPPQGAIMFGDPLTYEQCESLLQAVSKCDLPFQCAHGKKTFLLVFKKE